MRQLIYLLNCLTEFEDTATKGATIVMDLTCVPLA
jgi:hypothetical protein